MGLDYRTLKYKPTKEDHVDLLAKTWRTDYEMNLVNPIIVNEYYVARPDLISLAVYGTDEYADLICKWNGISNPFELNEDMIISLPPVEYLQLGTKTRETTACELISKDSTIQKPKSLNQRKKSDARSASQSTIGDKPAFVIDKTLGLVIY